MPMAKNTKSIDFTVALLLAHCFTVETSAQTITRNQTGIHEGFYFSFWNDGSSGAASMTLKAGGRYSTQWNNIGNFTAGKGWATGKVDRVVRYSGSFNGGSNGFLALYGWTKDSWLNITS